MRKQKPEFNVSATNARKIRAISKEALIPVEQVFNDVISHGLKTVREMYSTLITYRKSLEEEDIDEKDVDGLDEPAESFQEGISGSDIQEDMQYDPGIEYDLQPETTVDSDISIDSVGPRFIQS